MLQIFEILLELFSLAESMFFIWLFVFSKPFRTKITENWAKGNAQRIAIILDMLLSIFFNAIIIGLIIYIAF
jgi:hypothetical protein